MLILLYYAKFLKYFEGSQKSTEKFWAESIKQFVSNSVAELITGFIFPSFQFMAKVFLTASASVFIADSLVSFSKKENSPIEFEEFLENFIVYIDELNQKRKAPFTTEELGIQD